MSRYDRRLFEEWEEHQSFLELSYDIECAQNKLRYSAELYKNCLQSGAIPIRVNFLETYVTKGSYHILSDQLKIGWHPDYIEMLSDSSNEDVA